MKERMLVLSTLLTCLFMLTTMSIGFAAPQTPYLKVHLNAAESDLNSGVLDVGGWPYFPVLGGMWPVLDMNPNLMKKTYIENGMYEIDMNNHRWPTGCPYTSTFYDPNCPLCSKALSFRKAVAYLIDRNLYISSILYGNAYRLDVPKSPYEAAYVDMLNYSASGLLYNYNKTKAEEILNAAGFTVGSNGWRIDPITGSQMASLVFYVRNDDPNRMVIAQVLKASLISAKIPTTLIFASRWTCYVNVMKSYNYHLYTGGWIFSVVPDQYYDLYSSYTCYYPNGPSQNYLRFCNHEFDSYAVKVKYPATIPAAQQAARTCGYLFLKYCPSVPLYCLKGREAFKTGWTGVVNMMGYGIDNYYSFLNMKRTGDNTIDYGLKGDVKRLNVITYGMMSQPKSPTADCMLENPKVLNLVYESLLGINPWNWAPTGRIASSYTVGSWNAGPSGDPDATYITFTLKNNVLFHNATGNPRKTLTALDVNFSFYFTYQCGPSVAWNFPTLAQFNKAVVIDATHISIYYNRKTAWAVYWAGSLPIINNATWGYLKPGSAVTNYDPVTSDLNWNAVADIKEDGCGAWMFNGYVAGSSVTLAADPAYNYALFAPLQDGLAEMFHTGAGDVDYNGVVDMLDLIFMARALGTDSGMIHGIGWGQYNPSCDLDSDGYVNYADLAITLAHYGETLS